MMRDVMFEGYDAALSSSKFGWTQWNGGINERNNFGGPERLREEKK
jgi:hypothetical protein